MKLKRFKVWSFHSVNLSNLGRITQSNAYFGVQQASKMARKNYPKIILSIALLSFCLSTLYCIFSRSPADSDLSKPAETSASNAVNPLANREVAVRPLGRESAIYAIEAEAPETVSSERQVRNILCSWFRMFSGSFCRQKLVSVLRIQPGT